MPIAQRRPLPSFLRSPRADSLPRIYGKFNRRGANIAVWLCAVLLASCGGERPLAPKNPPSAEFRQTIERALPQALADRDGWRNDLEAAFKSLGIAPSHENVCAVAAVIEQESGFRVDPVIPGLPAIAWREIDERAAHAGVPPLIVHGVLQLNSPNGHSYSERLDNAKTEHELSDIYEDFIATVPLGRTLFADHNPIRTRGPMQVHIIFAEQFAAQRTYPYTVNASIADEVFTRRGGLYFGVAHLLAYPAAYDRYLYRFADFNAGQYASRNAAFQHALSAATGRPLLADGALLPHDTAGTTLGTTEATARSLARRLTLDADSIHDALAQGKTAQFERTALYRGVFDLAPQPSPYAVLPQIELHGPKISRKLTTEWYAKRVETRFERCLRQ